jgi:hypothetical protein
VKAADWYSSAINTAYIYELINGFEDGTFRPNDKITREQAMMIISKAILSIFKSIRAQVERKLGLLSLFKIIPSKARAIAYERVTGQKAACGFE